MSDDASPVRLVALATFWSSLIAAAWVVVGYPLALLLGRRRPVATAASEPIVSIVVPTYREFDTLPRKLGALATLDYPRDRLQVLVAVDGDPALVDVARQALPGVETILNMPRGGKAAAVNAALSRARGEVVVLTDANNVLEPSSVRQAVSHFADADVWAVAGQRREQDSAYDRYENLLRRLESRSGSVAAISGDFIAVRRERMPVLPHGVVNEDLWLLLTLVREGGRVVYEPRAESLEPALGASGELARRSRIGAGRLLLLGELRGLPRAYALRIVSHKYGRLALPFLSVAMLGSALRLRRHGWVYRGALALQLTGGALAGLSAAGVELPGRGRMASRAARQVVVGNAAVAVGVVRALRGRQGARWKAVR